LGFSAGLRRLRRQGDDLADPARRRTPGFVTPSFAWLLALLQRKPVQLMTSAERYAGAPQPAAIA
jgi:hypothetical protein